MCEVARHASCKSASYTLSHPCHPLDSEAGGRAFTPSSCIARMSSRHRSYEFTGLGPASPCTSAQAARLPYSPSGLVAAFTLVWDR